MLRALIIPLLGLSALANETRIVYSSKADDKQQLRKLILPLQEASPEARWIWLELPDKPTSIAEAELCAQAISHGIGQSPTIIHLKDEKPYAQLDAHGISTKAKPRAMEPCPKREIKAELYLIYAKNSISNPSDEHLANTIAHCRELRENAGDDIDLCQLIDMQFLYPMLMWQYQRGHLGAHSPETEDKLLEAVAALESARDADKTSAIGRAAHTERERLRMARRKARQYE